MAYAGSNPAAPTINKTHDVRFIVAKQDLNLCLPADSDSSDGFARHREPSPRRPP